MSMSPHVSLSTAVQYILDDLGLDNEFETVQEVSDIITKFPLKKFSAYFPFYVPYLIDSRKDQMRDVGPNTYIINNPQPDLTIRAVDSLHQGQNRFVGGSGGDVSGAVESFGYVEFAWNLMMDQATIDVWSAASLPDRLQFIAPNMVRIISGHGESFSSRYSGQYAVRLHMDHPTDLTTIRPNLFDKFFLEYAYAWFKRTAYGKRKRFENLSTPLGEIVMGRIDEFSSARDEIKELEEKMRNDVANSPGRRKVYST